MLGSTASGQYTEILTSLFSAINENNWAMALVKLNLFYQGLSVSVPKDLDEESREKQLVDSSVYWLKTLTIKNVQIKLAMLIKQFGDCEISRQLAIFHLALIRLGVNESLGAAYSSSQSSFSGETPSISKKERAIQASELLIGELLVLNLQNKKVAEVKIPMYPHLKISFEKQKVYCQEGPVYCVSNQEVRAIVESLVISEYRKGYQVSEQKNSGDSVRNIVLPNFQLLSLKLDNSAEFTITVSSDESLVFNQELKDCFKDVSLVDPGSLEFVKKLGEMFLENPDLSKKLCELYLKDEEGKQLAKSWAKFYDDFSGMPELLPAFTNSFLAEDSKKSEGSEEKEAAKAYVEHYSQSSSPKKLVFTKQAAFKNFNDIITPSENDWYRVDINHELNFKEKCFATFFSKAMDATKVAYRQLQLGHYKSELNKLFESYLSDKISDAMLSYQLDLWIKKNKPNFISGFLNKERKQFVQKIKDFTKKFNEACIEEQVKVWKKSLVEKPSGVDTLTLQKLLGVKSLCEGKMECSLSSVEEVKSNDDIQALAGKVFKERKDLCYADNTYTLFPKMLQRPGEFKALFKGSTLERTRMKVSR